VREDVPAELLTTTTQAALTGVLPAPVAALTQGVLQAMLLTKVKIALMIVLTLVLSGGLVAAYYVAASPGETQAKDDMSDKDKLQGIWEFVSGEMAGKKVEGDEAAQIKKHQFVFKGEKLTTKQESTYTIDSSKRPKEIDLKVDKGPEQEQGTWKGIYDLKGDELTLCMAPPNQDRPTEFVTKEDKMMMLLKLKRVK
jgi:uncharacterized protein (TIGR03067 family)